MKIKLVKFSNGRYGVRRGGWFSGGYEYKDLSENGEYYWFSKESKFFRNCMSSEESAREFFESSKAKKIEKKNNIEIMDEVIE